MRFKTPIPISISLLQVLIVSPLLGAPKYRAERILFRRDPATIVTGVDINSSGLVLANAHDYTYFTRAFLWQDGVSTLVSEETRTTTGEALNDSSEVAGWWSGYEGFVASPGQTVSFGTPGMHIPEAISAQGDAFGRTTGGPGTIESFRAVALIDGVFQDMGIDFPGYGISIAADVNSSNHVVGTMQTVRGGFGIRSWIWKDGQADLLPTDTPQEPQTISQANAINDFGDIVGVDYAGSTGGAAYWREGQLTRLAELGASYSYHHPSDVNNHLQIVGSAFMNGYPSAIVWDANGGVFDLNHVTLGGEGWHFHWGEAINNSGHLLVNAVFGSPEQVDNDEALRGAFLLTAVPEPSGLTSIFITVILGAARRNRGKS